VFGGYPLNKITREYIQEWVNRLTDAGKKPGTVRHAFFTVRMVLEQAVIDGRLTKNPAEHVKLLVLRLFGCALAFAGSELTRFPSAWF
jgi:hypothetical protein